MPTRKNIISVAMKLDISETLNEMRNELLSLAKTGGKSFSKELGSEISGVVDQISNIQEEINKLKFGKVNAKSFEQTNKNLLSQIDNLEKRTSVLEEGMKVLVSTMDQSVGNQFVESMKNISQSMDEVKSSVPGVVDGIEAIQKAAGKSGISIINANNEIKQLKDEQEALQELLETVYDFDKAKSNFKLSKNFLSAQKQVKSLTEEFEDLDDQIANFGEAATVAQQKRLTELQKRFVEVGVNFNSAMQQAVKSFGKGKFQPGSDFEYAYLKVIKNESIVSAMDDLVDQIESRAAKINESLSSLGNKTELNVQDGQLNVPIVLFPKGKGLAKQAERIIAVAQRTVTDHPLKITFELESAYSTKKTNKALSDFQKQINKMDEGELRNKFQTLYNQLNVDFSKAINLQVTSDVDEQGKKVKKAIDDIKEAADEKLHIFPTIDVSDEEIAKIQSKIDDIAKDLTLNIEKIVISQKAKDKIFSEIGDAPETDSKSKRKSKGKTKETNVDLEKINTTAKAVDELVNEIRSNISGIAEESFKPIVSSLENIKGSFDTLNESIKEVPENINNIVVSLSRMIPMMQKAFGLKTDNELDKMFDGIKNSVSKIKSFKISDLDSRNKAKDIVKQYQDYVSQGGFRSIEDLGGTKRLQQWLIDNQNQVFSTGDNLAKQSGNTIGQNYARGMLESTPEVSSAAAGLVDAATEAVASRQASNSPSKVAEQLGLYWGEGYAEGILKSSVQVKNAIRALVAEGKLTLSDLVEDTVHPAQSDLAYAEIVTGAKETKGVLSRRKDIQKKTPDEFALQEANRIKNFLEKEFQVAITETGELAEKAGEQAADGMQKYEESIVPAYKDIKAIQEINGRPVLKGELSKDEHKALLSNVEEQNRQTKIKNDFEKLSTEELQKQLSLEERYLARCKEGSDKYEERKANIAEINRLLQKTNQKEQTIVESFSKGVRSETLSDIVSNPKNPLTVRGWNTLNRLAKKTDTEGSADAQKVLEMSGQYVETGKVEILKDIQEYVKNSALKDSTKRSVTNAMQRALDDIATQLQKGAEQISEGAKETAKKTRTETMSKSQYKEWYRKNGLLADNEEFDRNFEKHLESLKKRGLATQQVTKTGKKGKWVIQVEVEDKGVDETAQKTEKLANAVKEAKVETAKLADAEKQISKEKTSKETIAEKDSLDDVKKSTKEASESKEKYVETNKEVISSISQSITSLSSEAEAFDTITKSLKAMTKLPMEKFDELAQGLMSVRDALSAPSGQGQNSLVEAIKSIADSGVDLQALSDVLSTSSQKIKKAQEILKGDKTKIVTHDGIKAFLDPTNAVDAKKMIIIEKMARKYADDLGEIVSIQRNVEADRLSYNVKGSNGNNVILGQDSEGGWIVSRQYLKESQSIDKIEERRYQSEQKAKERERKLIEDQAKAINKAQETSYNERLKLAEDMASGRERISNRSEKEEKTSEIEQAKAINKAQEESYKERLKKEEMYAKLFDEAELKQREKEKKQAEASVKEQERLDKEYGKLFDEAEAREKNSREQIADRMAESQVRIRKETDKAQEQQNKAINDNLRKEYDKRVKEYEKLQSFLSSSELKLSDDKLAGKEFTSSFNNEIDKAKNNIEELQTILNSKQKGEIFSDTEVNRIKEARSQIKMVTDTLSSQAKQAPGLKDIDKLLGKISKDINDNTRMAPELRNRFIMLRDAITQVKDSGEDLDKVSFKSFAAEFQHLHEEMLRAGQTGKGFFKSIADAARSQTTQFIARYFSLQDWIRYAQQGFEMVKSIDSALTELRKVSDASTTRLAQNFETSSKAAQDLGSSISGVINITADWSRLNNLGLLYSNV